VASVHGASYAPAIERRHLCSFVSEILNDRGTKRNRRAHSTAYARKPSSVVLPTDVKVLCAKNSPT